MAFNFQTDGGSWVRIGAVEAGLDARSWNRIIQEYLGHKAKSITSDAQLRGLIGGLFLSYVKDFVPMDSGQLQNSGTATSDGRLIWSAVKTTKSGVSYDYAAIQYEEPFFRHYVRYSGHTPTYAWVQAFQMSHKWSEFCNRALPMIVRRMENGNS